MAADGQDEAVKRMYESGKFDPRVYVNTFYPRLEEEEMFFLDCFHYIFSKKLVKGDSMLDLGTGPTMQTMISASAFVQKIVLSDFLEESRQELRKWLREDPGHIDFRFLYDHVAMLENRDRQELERRVRSKVTDVIPCDVTLSNPLAPASVQYDVVLSSLCLESAVATRGKYAQVLVNVAGLVKPGGYALLSGCFGCSEFTMGGHTFPMANLTHEVIEEALGSAGFKVLFWMVLPRDREVSQKKADFTHCYALAAQKTQKVALGAVRE